MCVLIELVRAVLNGHIGVMDALLQTYPGECASYTCFLSSAGTAMSTSSIQGVPLWIGETRVYNPPLFQPGSSLSHLQTDGGLMAPRMSNKACKFALTPEDARVMRLLGWHDTVDDHHPYHTHYHTSTDDFHFLLASFVLASACVALAILVWTESHSCCTK